jgi:amidase
MEPDGVLVIPTAPDPAPLRAAAIGDLETFRARALALLCAAGLAGLPQVSLPAARVAGAPVGLSLVGPPGRDHALLELAACLPHFS